MKTGFKAAWIVVGSPLTLFLAAPGPLLAAPLNYDIPAGEAEKTLQEYLMQTRIEMLYRTDAVRGRQTNAVQGELEPPEALARLLEGTGLDFKFTPDLSFAAVSPHEDTPPDDLSNAPSLPMPARQTWCTSCYDDKLQEVLVTGTLIHGVQEIAAPLEVIDRQRASTARSNTVLSAVEALPLTRGGGPSEDMGGAGNFARGTAINLRGLGPNATLVLIDGRRQPYSGNDGDFVDISSIPFAAIDRIEVLPDGASAIYGSDAVAGVVNVIMKKEASGQVTNISFDAGHGGSSERYVSQLVAGNWKSGHAMATFELRQVSDLPASARSYTRSADKRLFGGTDFRTTYSAPGNLLDPITLLPKYGLRVVEPSSPTTSSDVLPTLNLGDAWAQPGVDLLPRRSSHFGFLSAAQTVGDVELFTRARFAEQTVSQTLFGYTSLLVVPNSNPYVGELAAKSPYVAMTYDFIDDLGPMGTETATRTVSADIGAQLKLANDWHAVMTGSLGSERLDYVLLNQTDSNAVRAALKSSDPATAFNPFSPGHSPPATVAAIRLDKEGRARSTVRGISFTLDGPLASLPAGRLSVAIGGEARSESLSRTLPAPDKFSRSINSLYGEATLPIVGGSDRTPPRLELSLSGRYDSYSDSGATSNPRISLRFMPSDALKLRASWGTSFRAPKLVDANLQSNVEALLTMADPKSPNGLSAVLAILGNDPNLRPETARTWTAGFDLAPRSAPGLTASITYYHTDYENRIALPGSGPGVSILLEEDTWADVIQRDPSIETIAAICDDKLFRGSVAQCKSAPIAALVDLRLRNLAATRAQGTDLRIEQQLPTRVGLFDFGVNASYIYSFKQATSSRSAWVDVSNTVGNPPKLRAVATADWFQTRWDGPGLGANLAVHHMGAYHDGISGGPRLSSLTTADLRLSYRMQPQTHTLLSATEFHLKIDNVLNAAPPFANRDAGYDQVNSDPSARSVSFGVEKRW